MDFHCWWDIFNIMKLNLNKIVQIFNRISVVKFHIFDGWQVWNIQLITSHNLDQGNLNSYLKVFICNLLFWLDF